MIATNIYAGAIKIAQQFYSSAIIAHINKYNTIKVQIFPEINS